MTKDQEIKKLKAEVERLRIGHERYETARLMNPRQWSIVWHENVSHGRGFDQRIDELKPVLRPEAKHG